MSNADPFLTTPENGGGDSNPFFQISSQPHKMPPPPSLLLPNASPSHARHPLHTHTGDPNRRPREIGSLGSDPPQHLSDQNAVQVVDNAADMCDGDEIDADLRKKLSQLEHDVNEVGRHNHVLTPVRPAIGNISPTKVAGPMSRRQRNVTPGRVNDIKLATEISTSLLKQVRELQAALGEKDEALRRLADEKSRLLVEKQNLSQRIRAFDESEQRYKDESWSLETRLQEREAELALVADREKRLHLTLKSIEEERMTVERELEELKIIHSKHTDEYTTYRRHHDSELTTFRRNATAAETERNLLHKRIDELSSQNEQLVKAMSYRVRQQADDANENRIGPGHGEGDDSDRTPDASPPASPHKGTPRHGHLETETVKSSLNHALKMIQNLKIQLHREKIEKMELRKILQDAQDELDIHRNDNSRPGLARRTKDKPKQKKPVSRRPTREMLSKTEVTLEETPTDIDWEDSSPCRNRSKTDQDEPETPSRAANRSAGPGRGLVSRFLRGNNYGGSRYGSDSESDELDDSAPYTPAPNGMLGRGKDMSANPFQSSPIQSAGSLTAPGTPATMALASPSIASSMVSPGITSPLANNMAGPSLAAELDGFGSETGNILSDGEDQAYENSIVEHGGVRSGAGLGLASPSPSPSSPAPAPAPAVVERPWRLLHPSQPTGTDNAPVATTIAISHLPRRPLVASHPAILEQMPTSTSVSVRVLRPSLASFSKSLVDEAPVHGGISGKAVLQTNHHIVPIPAEPPTPEEPEAPMAKQVVLRQSGPVVAALTSPKATGVCANVHFPVPVANARSQIAVPSDISVSLDSLPATVPPKPAEPPAAPIKLVPTFMSSTIESGTIPAVVSLTVRDSQPKSDRKPLVMTAPVSGVSFSPVQAPMSVNDSGHRAVSAAGLYESNRMSSATIRPIDTAGDADQSFISSYSRLSQSSPSPFKSRMSTSSSIFGRPQLEPISNSDQGGEADDGMVRSFDDTAEERDFFAPRLSANRNRDANGNALGQMGRKESVTSTTSSALSPQRSVNGRRVTPGRYGTAAIYATPRMSIHQFEPGSVPSVPEVPSPFRSSKYSARADQYGASATMQALQPDSATTNGPASTTRRSSISSFVSEVDHRFNNINPQMGDLGMGTDQAMVQAITQTMIGEWLWKYTRRAGRSQEMSETRHERFFWVHPYTRTLYWSKHTPLNAGATQMKAKSVAIEAIRVVVDENTHPIGLPKKSLVVITPGRTVKFTAPTEERHDTWFNSLSHLLLKTNNDNLPVPIDATVNNNSNTAGQTLPPATQQRAPKSMTSRVSLASLSTRLNPIVMTPQRAPVVYPTSPYSTPIPHIRRVEKHTPVQSARSRRSNANGTIRGARSNSRLGAAIGTVIRKTSALRLRKSQANMSAMSEVPTSTLNSRLNSTPSTVKGRAGSNASYNIAAMDPANYDNSFAGTSTDDVRSVGTNQGYGPENVRVCCGGKHDVGSLNQRSKPLRNKGSSSFLSISRSHTPSIRRR